MLVYFFGNGQADGTRDMKSVLGGKGANLAEMTNLGVPVPPGFTIACSACIDYLRGQQSPDILRDDVAKNMRRLEEATGRGFGATTALDGLVPWAETGMRQTVRCAWPRDSW